MAKEHYGELGPEDSGTVQMDKPSQAQTITNQKRKRPAPPDSPTESSRMKSGLDESVRQHHRFADDDAA
jgi:hypothetical protein